MMLDFSTINQWVFDLDHTLYPKETCLFDQIEVLMVEYICNELKVSKETANKMRAEYWQNYGTTLAGLMAEHDMDPDPFLTKVHQINLDHLNPDPALADAINALPGRKIIYTNGNQEHAHRVSAARGIADCFDAVFGVEDANYIPKPHKEAFEIVFQKANISPQSAVMFEDDIRNLKAPFDMGMKTVLIDGNTSHDHVQHATSDLTAFLQQCLK